MVYGKTVSDSGFSDDDGSADREVTQALAAYQAGRLGKSELVEVLTKRRLLVAVVATILGEQPDAAVVEGDPVAGRRDLEQRPGRVEDRSIGTRRHGQQSTAGVGGKSQAGRGFTSEQAAEVMLITIKGSDGRTALPAFTSLEALSRWRARARPVPASTQRVCAGALSEGADLIVIDPAGPTTVELSGSVLWALAEGRALVPLDEDPAVIGAIRDASEDMARSFSGTFLQPGADSSTELVIHLVARAGVDAAELRAAATQLASRLAADPIMRTRIDGGAQIAVVNAPPPGGHQL